MALDGPNFRKRLQEKMGKPRSSVELKKLNYIIRLFSGLELTGAVKLSGTVVFISEAFHSFSKLSIHSIPMKTISHPIHCPFPAISVSQPKCDGLSYLVGVG